MRRRALQALWTALALATVLVLAILFQQGMLSRSANLFFLTDSASGLAPGTAVKLSGFRIGTVSAVQLQPDLGVEVTLKIRHEDFRRLRKDARAELRKEDVVQTAVLEINPGKSPEALSPEYPRIAFERGRSLGQTAQDLTDRLAPILEDIKALTAMLSDRERGLGPMLEKSRAASVDLAAAAVEMRKLTAETRARFAAVGAQAQGTLGDASAAFARLDGMAAKAGQSLEKIDTALPGVLVKINNTLDEAHAVVKDARTASSAAAESVPRALRDIQPAAEDAREILTGVKQSWPIRNMLPAKKATPE